LEGKQTNVRNAGGHRSTQSSPSLRAHGKVLPEDARRHNRALVLRSLFHTGPMSRADIARAIHLTRVTISDLVGDLLTDGVVEELGTKADQGVGKPATLLGIVPNASYVIALDLSDDISFHGALVDLAGKVQVHREVSRRGRTGTAAIELTIQLARELADAAERPVLGIGVGSPGVVDPAGIVIEAPNLGWQQVPLARHLHEALGHPVHVGNDANAAARAELTIGDGAERSLLLVKIGQGVGAGVIVDGHLIVGDRFAAGEIGHISVDDRGERCACGRIGCLETVVAAPRLRALLEHAGGRDGRRALAAAGRRLGSALAPIISALNLREIVLAGPIDVFDEGFRAAALDTIQRRTMPAVGENVDLRFSSFGGDDVLLGAAVLVLDAELGIA